MWGFGTVSNVTIRHNYINSTNTNPDPTATGVGPCIFLVDADSYQNVTVEQNFCDRVPGTRDYFQIRIANDGTTSSGHTIRNNRFSRASVPVELTSFYPAIWEDNRFIDNNELIPQPTVRQCLSRVAPC